MPKKSLPEFVPPMMASSAKEPFVDSDWIFESKLDGYRAIAVIDSTGNTRIWSRNHLPLEPKFPTVGDAVNQLKLCSTILDGEIVALDKGGIPRFQLLQKWQKRPTAPVVFSSSTYSGVTGVISPPILSCSDASDWKRSLLQSREFRSVVTSPMQENIVMQGVATR
jgi:ATP dependent DNA ligase domain